jgi:hypothetical protein
MLTHPHAPVGTAEVAAAATADGTFPAMPITEGSLATCLEIIRVSMALVFAALCECWA